MSASWIHKNTVDGSDAGSLESSCDSQWLRIADIVSGRDARCDRDALTGERRNKETDRAMRFIALKPWRDQT